MSEFSEYMQSNIRTATAEIGITNGDTDILFSENEIMNFEHGFDSDIIGTVLHYLDFEVDCSGFTVEKRNSVINNFKKGEVNLCSVSVSSNGETASKVIVNGTESAQNYIINSVEYNAATQTVSFKTYCKLIETMRVADSRYWDMFDNADENGFIRISSILNAIFGKLYNNSVIVDYDDYNNPNISATVRTKELKRYIFQNRLSFRQVVDEISVALCARIVCDGSDGNNNVQINVIPLDFNLSRGETIDINEYSLEKQRSLATKNSFQKINTVIFDGAEEYGGVSELNNRQVDEEAVSILIPYNFFIADSKRTSNSINETEIARVLYSTRLTEFNSSSFGYGYFNSASVAAKLHLQDDVVYSVVTSQAFTINNGISETMETQINEKFLIDYRSWSLEKRERPYFVEETEIDYHYDAGWHFEAYEYGNSYFTMAYSKEGKTVKIGHACRWRPTAFEFLTQDDIDYSDPQVPAIKCRGDVSYVEYEIGKIDKSCAPNLVMSYIRSFSDYSYIIKVYTDGRITITVGRGYRIPALLLIPIYIEYNIIEV